MQHRNIYRAIRITFRKRKVLRHGFPIGIGIDEERGKTEIERLGLSRFSPEYLENILISKYEAVGLGQLRAP